MKTLNLNLPEEANAVDTLMAIEAIPLKKKYFI